MKEAFDKMSVKLERESQEREEAMRQVREQEAKLTEANSRVGTSREKKIVLFSDSLGRAQSYIFS